MKNIGKLLAVSAILGFLVLMVVPVSALAAGDAQCPGFFAGMGPNSKGVTAHLDHLESLGYEVSDIRAAVENGDYETAHTLMQQFMEEHKDELRAPPAGTLPTNGERITVHLDHLESLGYEVSDIRAAVENGDYETAHTLMQQFMEEHKDELRAPPAGTGPANGERITAHLDHLESLGYEVSDIRAAVENGDYETAHMLMQQFMEEHKDELPTPPVGDRIGEGKRIPLRPSVSGERPGMGVLKARTALNR